MQPVWQGGSIVLLVLLAYWPALHGAFLWDDDSWTTGIIALLRDGSGLRTMWSHLTALQQYYPLAGTTFWLDYHLWGFWTLPYHVENVLWHAFAALLCWRLLLRLQLPGAWLAAALFACHPVMAESVAWITERKNVLSLVLYLGALLAYERYAPWTTGDNGQTGGVKPIVPAANRSRGKRRRLFFYGLAFILFLCALLTKTTTFSLPAVVLLIGWWKRGKIRWQEDIFPTLPFFALSISLCLATAWLEKNHVGAEGPDFALTFPDRLLIAGHVLWFYLGKLLWPVNLCFLYPQWHPDTGVWRQWLYPLSAAGVLGIIWLGRKRLGRGPVAAVLFYVGTLFPVLGFINAYGMRYSFVWDHWVYLPALGIIALVAALAARVAESLRTPAVVYGFGTIVLPVLVLLTWRQAGIYTDMETLWRDTLARNPDCWLAHNNLGSLLKDRGRIDEAMEHYQKAIQICPTYPESWYNLGVALAAQGRFDAAIEDFRKAILINPNYPDAQYNLGIALAALGRLDEAIANYRKAIELNPNFSEAFDNLGVALMDQDRFADAIENIHRAIQINPNNFEAQYNLGVALAAQGRFAEAIESYRKAIELNPNFSDALDNLGISLATQGRLDEAIENYHKAIRINPRRPETFFHLGMALSQMGRTREAVVQYREALRLNPNLAGALNNLAWVLAASHDDGLRDGREAVQLAQRACQLTQYRQPLFIGTLAAAYAEARRFDDAIAAAQETIALAQKNGEPDLLRKNQELLELYRAHKAYHETR